MAVTLSLTAATGGWILWNKASTFIDDWIEDNYEGYESKEEYPAFRALMSSLERLPAGRVLWEPSSTLVKFGTPVALMTIPYWTEHSSMEGIYFESSMTTPFHFLTVAEVAAQPSNPIAGLDYPGLDMERGVEHMRLLGVDYYIAYSDEARAQALAADGLTRLDTVGEFTIFSVDDSSVVEVPSHEPVVLEGTSWTEANLDWFASRAAPDVPLAADGPRRWSRTRSPAAPPRRQMPHTAAVDARVGTDRITFTTDAVGRPHWVKVSYFPNWRAEGAEGPYLASPSMMMVVPTQNDVELVFEWTWAEWAGTSLTLVSSLALIAPWTRRRLRRMAGT